MKRYAKEIAALVLQAALFYLFPLCAGPTDAMCMVVLMLVGAMGSIGNKRAQCACRQ